MHQSRQKNIKKFALTEVSGSHRVQQNQEEHEASKRHTFDQIENLHAN